MDQRDSRASGADGEARPDFGRRGRFADRLAFGESAEGKVETWVAGFAGVVPLARLPGGNGQGPTVQTPHGRLLAPDLLAFKDGHVVFLEVKRRTRPDLHRKSGRLVTGIEARDFNRYRQFRAAAGSPVVVVFVHDEGAPGFRGDELLNLADRIHHDAGAMLFWALDDLPRLRPSDILARLAKPAPLAFD